MADQTFDHDRLVQFWIESSDADYDTMQAMMDVKKYNWALFVGHLMIEKLLKAYFVRVNNQLPPFIHNLLRLAELCNIKLSDDQEFFFATVTAFNINTRYDDYKMSFQKKCTPEFTTEWVRKLNSNREWIKKLITI